MIHTNADVFREYKQPIIMAGVEQARFDLDMPGSSRELDVPMLPLALGEATTRDLLEAEKAHSRAIVAARLVGSVAALEIKRDEGTFMQRLFARVELFGPKVTNPSTLRKVRDLGLVEDVRSLVANHR